MRKGVSYIELLIVVGLVGIVGASVSPFLSNFILRNNLETTVDILVGSLRKSQGNAMDGKNNDSGEDWGVCLYSGDTIRVFLGTCDTPTISEDYSVPRSVDITGLNTITFSRLEGEPTETLTITVSTDIDTRTIILNAAGGIGEGSPEPPMELPSPTPTPTSTPGPTATSTPTSTSTPTFTPTPTTLISSLAFDSGYTESNVGSGGYSDGCGTHSDDETCNATASYNFVIPSGVSSFSVNLNGVLGLYHGQADVHTDLQRLCVDSTCYDNYSWICKSGSACCFWHYSETWNKGTVGTFAASPGTSHTISYFVQGGCSDWGEKVRAKVYGTIYYY